MFHSLITRYCVTGIVLLLYSSCLQKKMPAPVEAARHETSPAQMPVDQEVDPDLLPFFRDNQLFLAQQFDLPVDSVYSITGNAGLKVTVDPSILEHADGSSPSGIIHVSLIECVKSNDLFRHNLATVSNGKLLVSGGSYFVGISSDGRPLKVRKGKAISMEFPRFTHGEMELFYGQRDSAGSMNWKRTGVQLGKAISEESLHFSDNERSASPAPVSRPFEGFVFKSMREPVYFYDRRLTLSDFLDTVNAKRKVVCLDSFSFWPKNLPTNQTLDTNYLVHIYGPRFQYVIKKCDSCVETSKRKDAATIGQSSLREPRYLSQQLREYYAPAEVTSLGWINVDRFYKADEQAEMDIILPTTLKGSRVTYFALFSRFNGLIEGKAQPLEDGNARLPAIPVGEPLRLLSFVKRNGAVFHAVTDLQVGRDSIKPIFKEISMAELNKIFGKNIRT